MNLVRPLTSLALVLAFAQAAVANDYITSSRSDWLRYTGQGGQEVRAQIQMESGGWRLWSQFGGLGNVWVYADPASNWAWVWNGSTAEPLGNLGAAIGARQNANLGPLNNGTVTVASRGALTTTAGAFSDVTQLTLRPSAADAGVTSIWFARGVGIVQWEEQSIAGPRRFQLASALVGGRTYPTATTTPPPATTGATRAPSEHAPMETILWGVNDPYLVIDTYEDAFRGTLGSGCDNEVVVDSSSVASQVRYEMTQRGVSLAEVTFLTVRLDSVWMRDYGPIILKAANGTRSVADLDYYPGRNRDNAFPAAYASYRGWSRVHVPLSYEGGNFATDGRGLGLASQGVVWFNQGLSLTRIRSEFQKLGCDRLELFEPLVDEGTTHIDMFARVMTDRDALVSRYPAGHRQARVVDAAATKLQALGYNVVRVDSATSHDEYATYANAVFANRVALIPQYGNTTKDRAALDAYRALGYTPVGVDSRLIIQYGGATHCLSMQVPQ